MQGQQNEPRSFCLQNQRARTHGADARMDGKGRQLPSAKASLWAGQQGIYEGFDGQQNPVLLLEPDRQWLGRRKQEQAAVPAPGSVAFISSHSSGVRLMGAKARVAPSAASGAHSCAST